MDRLLEPVRRRIEQQVLGLSGVGLGTVDFTQPANDPGLYGPESIIWRVHGDFTSMLCGGISALLLQMLHPSALAGVWDHSHFRSDMLGRLRRTAQFISVTSFGPTAAAERLIARVRQIHWQVNGVDPSGNAYRASDPALLTWVHVAEARSFLAAHLRFRNPRLSGADQDAYYRQAMKVAWALGARDVPASRAEVEAYLQAMRPRLVCDDRTREVTRLLLHAPMPSRLAQPAGWLLMRAGIDLLPDWAIDQLHLDGPALRRVLVTPAVHYLARVLRWSVRNGAWHRAMRRMGRQPV
ncbi:Signal transduction sensory kinase [Sodalis praecaptivus]|uniref:Signal transduction sensory kinase n=1 Tax=Sodalis praecaptivus TaxID=1239307 RepID=K7T2Q6_9GAMM|nr:Signal transduction sensory kinase [Sodalis praecaptivus]AHF77729.1 Signal transduction sensory kinase [Sodalis praecaptivus]